MQADSTPKPTIRRVKTSMTSILRVADEGEPRRSLGARSGSVVSGEDTTDHVFVDLYAKGVRDLLGDSHAAETRIAPLHLDNGRDEVRGRAFRTGFATMRRGEKSKRYFRSTNALWNLSSVAGLMSAPSFAIRLGLTNSMVSPSTKRSIEVRFGARCLERLLITS
jgi:hypothetical protein